MSKPVATSSLETPGTSFFDFEDWRSRDAGCVDSWPLALSCIELCLTVLDIENKVELTLIENKVCEIEAVEEKMKQNDLKLNKII